ncbi:hyalin-like, partial [Saccostrea cucullata]|uniref:hyalin-like n=1 Tax=Saccostrea cuccullata TaxID=36930 RepID=UPI002ED542B9
MLPKHIAIVFIYLIMMNGVIMMAKAKKVFENNHCQYKKTSANMKSSKLILNGGKAEINGREYQCSDGTILQNFKGDNHSFILGETSETEHHITKRWFHLFHWLFIPAAIVVCVIFCSGESPDEDVNPPPNSPPTLTCPASGIVVYAERSQITASHYWSVPDAKDPDGDSFDGPTLISGSPNGSEFTRGNHTLTYEVSDNKGAKSTCSFSFSVEVISCQPIQPKDNSIMTCDGEFIYGSSCRIKCKEGHEMLPIRSNNEQVITCETDGVSGIHSESPNSCQEISCPGNDPALNPANGYLLCSSSDYTYKTVCSTRCESGYAVLEENQIDCQSNKMWSNHLPGCIDIQKPMINDCPKDIFSNAERRSQPSSVSWKEPTAIDNSGKVTIKQIKGQPSGSLFPLGSHTIVYSATDAEGNVSQNCTFKIHITDLTCTRPNIPDRYLLLSCPNGYVYGSFC